MGDSWSSSDEHTASSKNVALEVAAAVLLRASSETWAVLLRAVEFGWVMTASWNLAIVSWLNSF